MDAFAVKSSVGSYKLGQKIESLNGEVTRITCDQSKKNGVFDKATVFIVGNTSEYLVMLNNVVEIAVFIR